MKNLPELELEKFFTPEEIIRLKQLPPLSPDEEQDLRQIANILIDRAIEDYSNDILQNNQASNNFNMTCDGHGEQR